MIFILPLSLMPSSRVLAKPCMNAFHWSHAEGSDIKEKLSIEGRVPREKPHMWEGRVKVVVMKITQSMNTTEERNEKRKV